LQIIYNVKFALMVHIVVEGIMWRDFRKKLNF
jgi:hypothetical protein